MKYIVFLLLSAAITTSIQAQLAENTRIDTRVQFIQQGERPETKITIRYQVLSDTPLLIGNLRDYYGGGSNLRKNMTALSGLDGTTVSKQGALDSLLLTPHNKQVHFTYTLTYDSAIIADNSYAPNVGRHHQHFFFCQWMVPLVERKTVLHYDIQVDPLPEGWILYSSPGGESTRFSIHASMYNSFMHVIGAGYFFKRSYTLNGKRLNVYINNQFSIGNDTIATMIRDVVDQQHTIFNDFQFDVYSIALLPRQENLAGIAIPNMFICHVKKDVGRIPLIGLLSHEMMHRWVGSGIMIRDSSDFGMRHQWFKEGITDYLSNILLLDTKAITLDQFVDKINAYLMNVLENPYRDASEDSIKRVADAGKYGVAATKLPYYKGGLMAFLADQPSLAIINNSVASKTKNFIHWLWQTTPDTQRYIPEERFFSVSDSIGLPFRKLYQKYMLKGRMDFDLPSTLFDKKYTLKTVNKPVYDLGFSILSKSGKRFASDVVPTSPAYKAGIREGMEIISSNNNNRFSQAWCDCPITVVFISNGEQKTVTYMPRGKKTPVKQYVKKL